VRRAGRAIAVLLLGGVLGYGALFVHVWRLGQRDDRGPVDAIVVLGAAHYVGRPSPVLRARLDHATLLFNEGLAPFIVVTGGRAEGDQMSEATASHQYLVSQGVPGTAVVVRPEGRDSRASVASAAEWLEAHGLDEVVLVSDPFHMARLRAEARARGLRVHLSATRSSPISARRSEELRRLAGEAAKLPVVWLRNAVSR
jgi:uncharacterized SAM-binding protein YcdF (DUF218 family)